MDKYNPTNWKPGDVITSERLNKIENQLSVFSEYTFPIHNDIATDNDIKQLLDEIFVI